MSRTIELSEEEYAALERAASARQQTVQTFLRVLIGAVDIGTAESRPYETDDWLRHLGLSGEDIAAVKREVREEAETLADAQ